MKVLFVTSGNLGRLSAIIKAQGDSLSRAGIEVEYYLIRGKGIKGYLSHIWPLHKQLKNNHYDAVHAHYSLSAYVASLAGAKPLVVSLMGSDLKANGLYRLLILLFRRLFRWKYIIVKSRDMAEQMRITDVEVIPNGVNLDLFVQMDKAVCRKKLGWEDGVSHILFPTDPNRPEKDYPLAQEAIALLERKTLTHVFRDIKHKDTVLYYNAADVVLVTSKWEGSPNVIKEALACGCPIVSTDVGDVKERLSGLDGCYVANTRSPQEISEKLSNALEFAERTAGRDRLMSDELDDIQIARRIITLYDKASKKR